MGWYVEMHLKTSDWYKHGHGSDNNYKNVILHVVWDQDESLTGIPTLELKDRVSKILLQRYDTLMNATSFIPCEKNIHRVPGITWIGWKDRLLAERQWRKSVSIESYLVENNFHWEETCWWLLSRNFGIKVNADAFEAIARSLPLTLLKKHKPNIFQLEALLLGQGGLLKDTFIEDYPKALQKEYSFRKTKHSLRPIALPLHFLRMRPGNFPTLRLAQLAAILQQTGQLFSKIKETKSAAEVREWFDIKCSDYWNTHYSFKHSSPFKEKKLGEVMIDNIMVNTIVPLLFAYGKYHGDQPTKKKALDWLEETNQEENSITKGFSLTGIQCNNAYDSQALIELKTQYCEKKNCLNCSIGSHLLRPTGDI